MATPTTVINGIEYDLDTTLRVAYNVQGMNGHAPYSKVFSELGDMLLEKQIEILYISFKIANPEAAKSISQVQFLNYYLENYTLKTIMDQLKAVIRGVLGEGDEVEEVAQGN